MGDTDTHPRYRAERLRQRLAEDAQQLGVDVSVSDDEVVLRGAVSAEEERANAAEMAAREFPDLRVRNELTVPAMEEPGGGERLA
jgi:osmotically-inducible protein OsmY